jgi:hypothetical protein
VLNSWALLEKHIYHAHLHPCPSASPQLETTHKCEWRYCDQVFGDREEVYRHALVVHMAEFSARCPFSKSPRTVLCDLTRVWH